ncbi:MULTISPECIES: CaiB/BaiF CoA transferase family protein [Streptomyces]|uniref:CaiB/BaiF CoA transferase family protein n=1 Tax=Streptomyces TaxID=1883 RepID=UPI000BC379C3|nr:MULTISPECIES: CaiB/BaiF CoA-transferase family protein [Streptomyces]MDX2555135.1 CaiB/BaiF CoA-transferase family protein [Streptomyces stelliscabiei]MDX2615488.1 CaiB/BaiF CoA-transferase family protein [Streptomyces stelliscabiei]MDX2639474.1 CaiB/BaiF CoA-transferase family protein [Streptomyces stelliscabiei]MDX2663968.1 CaiB/BaiF CoA-transferase family protein [Streptomyces stelliscabiei]MDX2712896.1 CaiB/BaiF CoA-transferase family protein [Streptomyces stelliscabiei]
MIHGMRPLPRTGEPLPLDGVTVVAVEQAVAAPFATRQLADLGARVIKVERVDGGDFARGYDTAARGLASHFVWCNRGKESLALDLKDPRGLAVVRRLVADADVFVQNLAHGAAARLGLDAATLCAAHPRLIAVDISGYGASGPYADKRAYDMLVQCEAGLVSVTGTPEQPVKAGIPAADIAAGMYAFSGVLAALVRRGTTGRGGPVEVSMLEALAEWMGHPLHHTMHGGTAPARTGLGHAVIAPYDAYATADGGRVLLSVQNDREWRRLAEQVLARPELADDPAFATNPARVERRERTDELVASALGVLGTDAALERLEAAGIACARLRDVTEVAEHPQLAARDRWREVESPVGPLRTLLPPITLPGGDEARMGAVPALGEHTGSLLRAAGMTDEEIAALRRDGVVA